MRLYGVKIYKSGVLDRNFVPCLTNGVAGLYETCQNRFFPLTGGKVRGKGYQGQTGEFEISPQPATLTSGIRVGTPAVTSRGFKEDDMKKVAELIYLTASDFENKADYIRSEVEKLCAAHPIYE